MTAISLIIPPLLHYYCFRDKLNGMSTFLHFFVGIFSTIFMGISTYYSAIALFNQKYSVCKQTLVINLQILYIAQFSTVETNETFPT